jgi:SAM-dependent methyltransferase
LEVKLSFRIADDPDIDYKALVKTGYDRCASNYVAQRCTIAPEELCLITERLSPRSSILEVGCGAGMPTAKYLSTSHGVTGVDISPKMIDLARANVPSVHFIEADIMTADFPKENFDAIVSFYALSHIPRQEHEALFYRLADWLKPGGLLLVTLAQKDDGPGYTEEFCGVTMYWSNFGLEVYKDLLKRTGFRIEQEGIVGHGYDSPNASEEVHPFIFCVRADDSKNRTGELEPVGTHRNYRRMGLGKAVVLEGLRSLKRQGATEAIVYASDTNEAAIKLYESVGFRTIHRFFDFSKRR